MNLKARFYTKEMNKCKRRIDFDEKNFASVNIIVPMCKH